MPIDSAARDIDSDGDLMARLAEGDDLALNTLMTRWSDRLIAFLFRLTGRHDAAIDLAQETFVKIYQARSRYRPGGSFSTWMFAIASNLARNHARWIRRHPTVSLDAIDSDGKPAGPEASDPGTNPTDDAIARETLELVDRAVLSLPHDLREALLLFVHEDLGYAEIGGILRCSPKAVETRIYRARQILKKELAALRS